MYTGEDLRGQIKYKEKMYCLEDPGEYGVYPMKLTVGAQCFHCKREVCLEKSCSRFERNRVCVTCDR